MNFVSRESGNFDIRGTQNSDHKSPMDQSLGDLLYNKTNGSKRWKTCNHFIDKRRFCRRQCQFRFYVPTISGLLQLHVLITSNSGQHFAGNSELFPVWRHSFRNDEMIYEIDHILNCGYEIKWSHDPHTSEFIFQGSLCSCKNCEDDSFTWFCIRAVQYTIYFRVWFHHWFIPHGNI